MTESHHVSILDHFADLDDPRAERTRRHQFVDIIWWTSLSSPFAPRSAAPIPGSISNSSARASWPGFKPSWNCLVAFHPIDIPAFAGAGSLALFLPVRTQPNSRAASGPGPRPARNCCPVQWWPLTARRPDGRMIRLGTRGPYTWSAPGPRRTL